MLSRSLCLENEGGKNGDFAKITQSVGFNFRDKVTNEGAEITQEEMRQLADILKPIYARGVRLEINYSEIPWTT